MLFKEIVDRHTHGRTQGRLTFGDHKSSPCHFVTGELKTEEVTFANPD